MTAPCLHLTIRERSGGVLSVEIPRSYRDRAEFAEVQRRLAGRGADME
jgi:hypothetical protein